MKSSVFLISNQLWFSPLNLYGSWNNQDYQIWFLLQNLLCILPSCDFLHSLVTESKQRLLKCRAAVPYSCSLLWSKAIGNWANFLIHFSRFSKDIFFIWRGMRGKSAEKHGRRQLFYIKVVNIQQTSVKGLQGLLWENSVLWENPFVQTNLSLFCQSYI